MKNEIIANDTDIQNKIYTIRGMQVMLDRDLAKLYNVETRVLKQAVKRNIERFPKDFMFELTDEEIDFMVSQSVIPSKQHLGGSKPFVFTEEGVSMLSSLTLFSKFPKIKVTIYTNVTKQLKLDFEKYKKQYNNITLKSFKVSHDRFLIIDDNEAYHIGASLKDLGNN